MTPLYNTRWCNRVYSPLMGGLIGDKIFHSFISFHIITQNITKTLMFKNRI